MNKVFFSGRLVRDCETRYSVGTNPIAISKFTIAVDRKFQKEGEPTADFFLCKSFGKAAEFHEKYYKKGIKVILSGRFENETYTNKAGVKVTTAVLMVEDYEFAEKKAANNTTALADSEFMNIPNGMDEEIPFN